MSRSLALSKLARAAKLNAEATKLFAEAADELGRPEEEKPSVDVDDARLVRALKKAGARI